MILTGCSKMEITKATMMKIITKQLTSMFISEKVVVTDIWETDENHFTIEFLPMEEFLKLQELEKQEKN